MTRPVVETRIRGLACRCGAIRLEVSGDPIVQFYCHCDDCRAVHGAAYVPESVFQAAAVKVTQGTPNAWTLKRNPRVSCGACGTRLFIDVLALGLRGINGYVLPPGLFAAEFHMQCGFAVEPVRDGLPHYKGRPPRFGGTDERVEW
jgi:hypothetical protein